MTGTHKDAEELKNQARDYLKTELKLEMSEEKTKITHLSTDKATFLGYDIKINAPKTAMSTRRRSRTTGEVINMRKSFGKPKLLVPKEKLMQTLIQKGIANQEGFPKAVGKFIFLPEEDTIIRYSAITRGIMNYYALAENRSSLNQALYILQYSLIHTLAAKHKSTTSKTIKKYGIIPTVQITRKGITKTIKYHRPTSLSAAYLTKAYPISKKELLDPISYVDYSIKKTNV